MIKGLAWLSAVVCIAGSIIIVIVGIVVPLAATPALGIAACLVWLLLLSVRAKRKWHEAPFGWTTEEFWAPTIGADMPSERLIHRTHPGKEVTLTKFLAEEVMGPFMFPAYLIVGSILCGYMTGDTW